MHPIGVFDSGLGGISVWKEVVKLLPNESFIYFADSGHCPYGEKSHEEIYQMSRYITQFLIEKGCKAIVIACNTATAAAIKRLREEFDLPFIGIEPAVKPAAQATQTGVIGILATKGTLEGTLFKTTKKKYANDIEVIMQIGTGLVKIVEQNKINSPNSLVLVQQYIEPMVKKGVDQIVLGCTHYPFLIELFNQASKGKAVTINPAPAVARQLKRVLKKENLLEPLIQIPNYQFFTSGDKRILADFLKIHTQYADFIETHLYELPSEPIIEHTNSVLKNTKLKK